PGRMDRGVRPLGPALSRSSPERPKRTPGRRRSPPHDWLPAEVPSMSATLTDPAVTARPHDAVATRASRLTSGEALVGYVAALKLALHLATAGVYGLFIDELYFLAAGEHLAWGYVDFPP